MVTRIFTISALLTTGWLTASPALAGEYSYSTYDAHAACKQTEDNRQIVSGLVGAVAGGIIGSQVSGNGARTEGSAIGAVIGGLAGAGLADKSIDCDPVYETPAYQDTHYYRSYEQSAYQSSPSSSSHYYPDRVTYSQHPVYSNPGYGAGSLTYGTHYTGTTTHYPASVQPVRYVRPAHSAAVHHRHPPAHSRVAQRVYTSGQHHNRHYHGRYICYDRHR